MFPQPKQSYRTTVCNDNGRFRVEVHYPSLTLADVLQSVSATLGAISLTYVVDGVFIINRALDRDQVSPSAAVRSA
jgi:hypothetical protein